MKPFLSSSQASLRSGCVLWEKAAAAAAAGTRHFSSDNAEKVSRYPVPYKKDLPYDIVELMEEVESKVTETSCDAFTLLSYSVQHNKIVTIL